MIRPLPSRCCCAAPPTFDLLFVSLRLGHGGGREGGGSMERDRRAELNTRWGG